MPPAAAFSFKTCFGRALPVDIIIIWSAVFLPAISPFSIASIKIDAVLFSSIVLISTSPYPE
jgi:hypothetical protein